MAGRQELLETCPKDEEECQIKSNIDIIDKTTFEDDDDGEIQTASSSNSIKRYPRYDLLSLRNAQLSTHYPNCALRHELQALSIWSCRLRCELQYLGLWKIPNTGNSYGSCSCNGNCPSYACDTQPYSSSNTQTITVNTQICYGNAQQNQQIQPMQTTSAPTLGSKKAVRSRERFLNYQRCINTELIRVTSPIGGGDSTVQHHLNHQVKPAFIDHRSISSSHLMPAFAKRRMGHTNALQCQSDASSNYNSNDGHNMEHLSNDDSASENTTHYETSSKSRKDSLKNNQNDYYLYKATGSCRHDKSDKLVDNQSGWINLVKKINSEFTPSTSKTNNTGSVNKKLIYERRIGSGRLVPREVNWDVRTGSNKPFEKENSNIANNNVEKDKDILSSEIDKLNIRNCSNVRYSDPRSQERRVFDRHVSNSEDSNPNGNISTSKRYTTSAAEEKNNFDSSYQQQTSHYTGQRSMSFRRREYAEQKDYHRDLRDFREPKDLRDSRENREQKCDHHHRQNHHRDRKDEPEWFSEGPTSQNDTIELRGFEEVDDSQQQEEQTSGQHLKLERKTPETLQLPPHNKISNVNMPTKDNFDVSKEVSNNSNNTIHALDKDIDNDFEARTPNSELTEVNQLKTDVQVTGSTTFLNKNLEKRTSNVPELFFDNFMNIDAFENSLIGSGNDQSMSANNESGGTSRFSRWFFNNSNNNQNCDNEFNNNPPNKKEDSKQVSKDLNESDFNSFMSFLKCNNIPTPELPKGLPFNVSPLSVEELEASLRKMDSVEIEKNKSGQSLHKNEGNQTKSSEKERKCDTSPHSTKINTQDVEAFRKLLDQLGKPQSDISMNIVLTNNSTQAQSLTTNVGPYSTGILPMQPSNSMPQNNLTKQEYLMKMHHHQIMHHQQNVGKMFAPLPLHHKQEQQTENMPLISLPNHPHAHHMSMIMGHPQKRLDVRYLIQSVVREELSRSFLEKELQNPNIPPYTKEIISTVLKETSRGSQNASDSIETSTNNDISTTPNNLIQSLARGEVSLNLLEHEINKLNTANIIKDASATGTFKERSRCGTPLTSLNVVPLTGGGMIVPLPNHIVPVKKQISVLTNENASSEQQQPISSMLRSQSHEDFAMHMPTQRELQMHTQAIMQNAMYKKKLEIDHQETLKRRQDIHKHQELERAIISQQHQQQKQLFNSNSTISQQAHQQSSRHINSPTPLAFTPTSVLRKMTAEKEAIINSAQSTVASASPQQMQSHLQQSHLKIPTHSQMSYQHSNQPRMILGGGNYQYMHQHQQQVAAAINGSPQISPEQKSQIRNQPPGPLKWPLIHPSIDSNHSVLNNLSNKPMGRPILKGTGPLQPLMAQSTHNPIGQNHTNVNQTTQQIQTVSQIQKYPSNQQPRQIIGQQFSTHAMPHQIPTSQQNNMQQQLFQQQRSVVIQRQQIQQNDLGNHAPLPLPAHHPPCNDTNSINNLNYQRDGGLSPTSNQLAQWFSPELLAQASAGKLPLLNVNQALSLEEFERSIQHSSTAVNN